MIELYGSIWLHFMVPDHFVCITTNGTVKKNGEAVMGRGNARQATICIQGMTKLLGAYLNKNGNVPGVLPVLGDSTPIIVFPVKHNWWEKADKKLIAQGARWLLAEAKRNPSNIYHLPRPGCGNGKLNWEHDVEPILQHLPDNVIVHQIDDAEKEYKWMKKPPKSAH